LQRGAESRRIFSAARFEELIARLSASIGVAEVVLAGEYRLAEDRIRRDYAVHVSGALAGESVSEVDLEGSAGCCPGAVLLPFGVGLDDG
jgi:hypothetical protein